MISRGHRNPIMVSDLKEKVTDFMLLQYYFHISELPIVIKSPLRKDRVPSFGIFTSSDDKVHYKDYATGVHGDLYDLLGKLWNLSYKEVLFRIHDDFLLDLYHAVSNSDTILQPVNLKKKSKLQVIIREWRDYDLAYWSSYGISLPWLQYAEVYPLSKYILTPDGGRDYIFAAEKYAYVFVEHKEGKTTFKIYQPFMDKTGWKWINKHDKSILALWTKIPEKGNRVCICSSVKDALCLYANLNIPSIAIQGEGMSISDTAKNQLLKRFKRPMICLDNDQPGLDNAIRMKEETGFENIVLPHLDEYPKAKDISDIFKVVKKETFIKLLTPLFK